MTQAEATPNRAGGIAEPLRNRVFRRIWLASLLFNLGMMILAVGAAWAMTQLTGSADMIALVQTALMLPIMLVAIPAGAVADMYDRRRVGLVALALSLVSASALAALTGGGALDPWLLLLFCFLIGSGLALFGPAWQASVSEQVPANVLPQAVALNSISYNIARSFGPAIGGLIVASAGAIAAFSATALLCIPLVVVLLLWRRAQEPSRLPPERLYGAITSGFRYVVHSPSIRVVLGRAFATSFAGGSISALMPVVARDLLAGGALTYGLTLGAFGMGAVLGALNIGTVRHRVEGEKAVLASVAVMALMIAVVALSHHIVLTILALGLAGAGWMISITLFNVAIQLSAPRWVTGRTLASFQAAVAGGIAIGSWLWGHIAESHGVSIALLAAAVTMGCTMLLGRWLRMPSMDDDRDREAVELGQIDVVLALKGRSGPIVVEREYVIDPDEARAFYGAMQQVQLMRSRNGAYNWSIARDIADLRLWTERFHCPTWHDYLRLRGRYTPDELALDERANSFHRGTEPIRTRRMLERPFGSVRWREDAPDRGVEVLPIGSPMSNG